ncbi:hypothetical protein [Streptacidiphilus cavernicola]|uniref:DUF3040 domain-containing protein n=1 Tax=Streptacidiphilus cavernicola TaxID=3342716 RepID=A0ABV6W096_9ACTN
MDGPTLSRRELQMLAGIEERLRADAELDRRLRTMKLHRARHLWHVVRAEREITILVLLASAGVLLAVGVPAVRPASAVVAGGLVLLILAGAVAVSGPLLLARRRRPSHAAPSWEEAA